MRLETLTAILAGLDPALSVEFSDGRFPHRFDSWRGDYAQLTLTSGPERITVGDLLIEARAADGGTFEGWKGGEFFMRPHTPVWADERGDYRSTAIVDSQVRSDRLVLVVADIGDYA